MSMRSYVLAAAFAIVQLGCACDRPICKFEAAPARVCPNSQVLISWETGVGEARITPGIGAVPAVGEQRVPVASTTEFRLAATHRGASQSRPIQVTVTDGSSITAVQRPLPGCRTEYREAVSLADPPEGSAVHAIEVANGGLELVTVTHEGVTAAILPGTTSSAFGSTSLGGAWLFVVHTNRRSDDCVDAGRLFDPSGLPPVLNISIRGACV